MPKYLVAVPVGDDIFELFISSDGCLSPRDAILEAVDFWEDVQGEFWAMELRHCAQAEYINEPKLNFKRSIGQWPV